MGSIKLPHHETDFIYDNSLYTFGKTITWNNDYCQTGYLTRTHELRKYGQTLHTVLFKLLSTDYYCHTDFSARQITEILLRFLIANCCIFHESKKMSSQYPEKNL